MNQTQGILIFGFCFFIFLSWLWRYPGEEQLQPPGPGGRTDNLGEVDQWLAEHGLESLKKYMRVSGVKTLEGCLSVDTSDLYYQTDSQTLQKFKLALPSLELVVWLKQWNILDYKPVLQRAGYSSQLLALCDMQLEKAKQISEELPAVDKQGVFMEAVKELQDTDLRCVAARQKGRVQQGEGSGIGGVLYYIVIVLVIVVVVIVVLAAIGTMIAAVVANVIMFVFEVLFTVLVVGMIEAIFSAFTGRRVQANRPAPQYRAPQFRIPIPSFTRSVAEVLGTMGRTVYNALGLGDTGPRVQPVRRPSTRPPRRTATEFTLGLYERMRGMYLDVNRCVLEWNHDNEAQVGAPSVITIKLVCKNCAPYQFKVSDTFKCKIYSVVGKAEIPYVVEPTSLVNESQIKVSFTAKISGTYRISLMLNTSAFCKGEIFRKYLPGPVDSNKTVMLDKTAVLVVTRGVYSAMKIIPKDSFGNKSSIEEAAVKIEIRKDSKDGDEIFHELVVYKNDFECYYELLIKLDEEGHYVGKVTYEGVRMGPPKFTIISLSEEKMQIVEKNVKKKNLNVWYEATQVMPEKTKKVYCYISPRQLQVREYFMKLIPTRTFTCKVSPSTQIIFHPQASKFTLDDGFQEPVVLLSPNREILGATFHKFVLKNIGGSEKFQDKQSFFYGKLREHHHRQSRSDKRVLVQRNNLLESARQATKNFSQSDWCKKFSIVFKGEEGLDWGGLSREFFELICVELFDASNKLFMRFSEENHQALVHPNHCSGRLASLKPKHFNFAGKIVGKCLYESCVGNTLLVKARFTRSFLAQLIGLRINYKYLETDDPDLHTTKIQYILDNDVTDLGLVFAEEEFDCHGGPPTVIPLVEGGEEKEVTEDNKLQYLNALAHYRLTKRVHEEISQFMKGLNEIVPDNLLSIFDENELELLMCGMDTVSYEDLKEHAVVSGSSLGFQQTLSWFWIEVSSFTQEEMAKLLQFVSGCSQLPPGGFKELNPRFTITSAPTRGRLPTAHTCFNQLCLPEYNTCEQFHTSLMTALNEGAEGFGLL